MFGKPFFAENFNINKALPFVHTSYVKTVLLYLRLDFHRVECFSIRHHGGSGPPTRIHLCLCVSSIYRCVHTAQVLRTNRCYSPFLLLLLRPRRVHFLFLIYNGRRPLGTANPENWLCFFPAVERLEFESDMWSGCFKLGFYRIRTNKIDMGV